MTVNFELLPAGTQQIAIATLNAEKSLNSLSLSMIESLHSQLVKWEKDKNVIGVLIRGQGRAFCAGGDIRALYDSMKDKSSYVQDFFEKEYALDASLYTYSKPLIVWAHGITMGGGMGIMQGAKYRIVTESTRMAMPEITIGLFPDVGASYFLKKVPHKWGLFLGLSGARIKGADAVSLKLADALVSDTSLEDFLNDVQNFSCSCTTTFAQSFEQWLKSKQLPTSSNELESHQDFIEKFLSNSDAKTLMKWARNHKPSNDWEKTILKNVTSACPTSLGIIYTLWEKSKTWTLAQSFYHEWNVASQCGAKGDFLEGVRALLIDKDNNPKWNPAAVSELTQSYIDTHFISPRSDGKNPLEFLITKEF